ncbi:hypothetical protein [Staphylococcus saccharolyticus]|uniref:hypothetical protein n=1 Tax=Staphylococcus saccharolyticus TaxID=33028 RepID=UPI0032DEBBC3
MSKENRSHDKVEVIDPSDERYRNDDYFKEKNHHYSHNNKQIYKHTYSYGCTHTGCGCSLGCLSILLISFILSLLIYWII